MKSERRHELQENALAAWLTKVIEKVKPFSQAILGGAIIVVVGVVVFQWLTREGPQEKNLGWDKVFSAIDADDRESLELTAKANADRASGQWAALLAAQQYLQAASEVAFSIRGSEASESLDLQKAIILYDTLIDDTEDKFLKTKALLGKAQALELTATDENLDIAKGIYGQIAKDSPESAAGKEAQRRFNSLNDPQITGADGFYAWYRDQDFKPVVGIPGFTPTLDSSLPGLPDISIGDSDTVTDSPLTDPLNPSGIKLPGSDTPNDEPSEQSKFSDPKKEDETEADETKAVEEKTAPAAEKVEEKTAEPAEATEEAAEEVTEETTEEDSASE